MRFRTPALIVVAALVVVSLPGQAETPAAQGRLFGIGDLPGGEALSAVRDAVEVGGTLYAVGGSAAIPLCPQPMGVICSPLPSTDTAVLWTFDGATATLTALPNLLTGPAFTQAGALTPDAAYLASMVRSNGPSASRVSVASLTGILGNTNPQLLTTSTSTGTLRIFDDLMGQPNSVGNRPQAAVSISHDGSVLYGGVRQYTRAARFDVATGVSTLIPPLPGHAANLPAPRATSADGSVMLGTSFVTFGGANFQQHYPNHYTGTTGRVAFRYVHPGAVSAIPAPVGNTWSKGIALSADGDLALVSGDSAAFPKGQVYLHRASTNGLVELGSPNTAWVPTGFGGTTADGSVVAVSFTEFTGHWVEPRFGYVRNSHGWFHLASAMYEAGIDVAGQGWDQFMIAGMTADATLVFGHALHNGTTEGFVAQFDPGFLAGFNPQPTLPANTAIVGAWTDDLVNPTAVVTFMADGSYYVIGSGGFERGLYRFDGSRVRAITLVDTDGDAGISDANAVPGPISLLGDELLSPAGCIPGEADCSRFTRIVGGPGSIVGGWRLGDATQPDNSTVVVVLANGAFFMAEDGVADAYGQDGVEVGTYFWNPSTGEFGANLPLAVDTNGEWGLSHTSGNETLGLTADELQLVSTDGVGGVQAIRILDPATVVPAITSAHTASATATTPFAYTITASRGLTFGSPDAPAWLSANASTGEMAGTPPAAGTISITITATNTYGDTDSATLVLTIEPPNTSAGSGITVQPAVPPGGEPISLAFTNVTTAGETTVTVIDSQVAPPPPDGFQVGGLYYDLTTTAEFSGPVTVCFSYAGADFGTGTPRLFHYEGGAWTDITTTVDTVNEVMCGVTMSFSPFAILVSPVVRTGFYAPVSQTPGFVNSVKGGSTVPLRFNVYVNGVAQTSVAGLTFGVWAVGCADTAGEDPVDFTTSGATSLRYDEAAGHFTQNWKTPRTPGCYVVRLTTDADGLSISALFTVK